MSNRVYFDALREGDEIGVIPLPLFDRVSISRWAGAVQEHDPLSVDEEFAKRAGFPSVCVPGPMAFGHIAEIVATWLRPGQVKRVSVKFRKILWPGDRLVLRGRIVRKRTEGGECYVDLEVWAENQKGDLVIKGEATSRLFRNVEDEDRHRRGLAPMEAERPPSLLEVFEREIVRPG